MKDIDGYVTKDDLYRLISRIKRNPDVVVNDKTCHTIVNAISDMPAVDVQPVDRWISVDERLPNTDERVLVYIPRPDNHYNIEIAYISEGNDDYPYWALRDKSQFYSTRFYYISHWQSLPELPKDGEKYA